MITSAALTSGARAVLVVLQLAPALSVAAATIPVKLVFHSSAAACEEGVVVARAAGHERIASPFTRKSRDVTIVVPQAPSWQVTVEGNGCWSREQIWMSGEVTLEVQGTAMARGRFAEEPDSASGISGTISSSSAAERSVDSTPVACSLRSREWECIVPAGRPIDLHLVSAGYAPLHFWDLSPPPNGVLMLGSARLQRGASVAGWVERPDGTALAGARIRVAPLGDSTADGNAQLRTTESNQRGFFQIAALAAGQYSVISEAPSLSPATTAVELRESETLILDDALRHAPLATLDLVIAPPLDRHGAPWRVELQSDAFPRVRVAAGPSDLGRWRSEPLPANKYHGIVRSSRGDNLARFTADLSGGDLLIPVEIAGRLMQGRLLLGDRGLEATLTFTRDSGERTEAETDARGAFEALFPAAGRWRAAASIPRPPAKSMLVEIGTIDVPDDPGGDELILRLPGGQISGIVTGRDGAPVRAAVRIRSGTSIVAQQITAEDARFDFLAIAEGEYEVEARGEQEATSAPVRVSLAEDEAIELVIPVERLRVVKGIVRAPDGSPASGAAVRISEDGALSWSKATADRRGMFSASVPSRADVVVAVSTYLHPSTVVRVPSGSDTIDIRLQPRGGVLRLLSDDRTPFVVINQVLTAVSMLWYPEPFGRYEGGVLLPPGEYVACPTRILDAQCRKAVVQPGLTTKVDFRFEEPGG